MKKTMVYILSAVLILSILVSCDRKATEPKTAVPDTGLQPIKAMEMSTSGELTFESAEYAFRISFPESWAGNYEVVDDAVEGVIILMVSSEKTGLATELARIKKIPSSQYLESTTRSSIELIRKLEQGENSDVEYVYAMFYGDGSLEGNDPAIAETYSAMLKDLPDIANSFKLIQ